MQKETLGLLRETRATTMIVTHHPEEAMRLGDRIAVMRAGRLVQEGKAEALYHTPASLFVARLFSEINEVPYIVRGGAIDTPAGRIAAPGIADGETAILCIRERGIGVSREGAGLAGRLIDVKFLGDAALLDIVVQGFEAPLRVRTHERHGLEKGAEVRLEVDPARVLIFPERAQ
jgi:iron(III) transport system ATP-binding protein